MSVTNQGRAARGTHRVSSSANWRNALLHVTVVVFGWVSLNTQAQAALPSCPANQVPVYYYDGGTNTAAAYSAGWRNCIIGAVGGATLAQKLANGETSKGAFESASASCNGAYTSTWESPLEWRGWDGIRHFQFCNCHDYGSTSVQALVCSAIQYRSDNPTPPSCPAPGGNIPSSYSYNDVNAGCRPVKYYVRNDFEDNKNSGACDHCSGNPINTSTGNKFQKEIVYQGAGDFPLVFGHFYNSVDQAVSPLGRHWRSIAEPETRTQLQGEVSPFVQGGGNNSELYDTQAAACVTGWAAIRSKAIGLAATQAVWANNTCTLMEGSVARATIPVYPENAKTPVNAAIAARWVYRPDGKAYRFQVGNGGNYIADDHVTARLENTANGLRLTENDIVEQYGPNGKLESVTSPTGAKHTLVRDAAGRLESIYDNFGRTLTVTYDALGRYHQLTDPEGKQYTYAYNGRGDVETVTFPDQTVRRYHYQEVEPYLLTGITDENGDRFATWTYDSMGRAKTSEHATGIDKVTLTYGDGQTSVEDALGTTRTHTFRKINDVYRYTGTSEPCPGCGTSTSIVDYDARGFVNKRINFNGVETGYTNDARGLESQRIEAKGTALQRVVNTTWHPDFRVPTRVEQLGGVGETDRITTYTYDPVTRQKLTETITDSESGESRTTTWTYVNVGGVSKVDTVDGPRTDVTDVTNYDYDHVSGNLIRITDAEGNVTNVTQYDDHGNPLRIEDPNGVVTVLTYDDRQRLRTRTVGAAATDFDYDDAGLLDRVTFPDSSYLDYGYDDAHRLVEIKDALGNRIDYVLDLKGNRLSEKIYDPVGALKFKKTQVFDVLSRLEVIKNAANDIVMEHDYDKQGNRISSTETSQYITGTPVDALNRVTDINNPDGGNVSYGYNALDQLVSVRDPKSLLTSYEINALGSLKTLISPDTGETEYEYDAAGNRISETDARGFETTYTYDRLNRLTAVTHLQDSGDNITYTYDGDTAYGKGRLTGIDDASSLVSIFYDARGNVVEERRQIKGFQAVYSTRYTYTLADRIATVTYPTGRVVTYAYDAAGQTQTVSTTVGGATTTLASNVAHLPFGKTQAYVMGDSSQVLRTFDQNYRIASLASGSVLGRTYDHDLRGNIREITDSVNPGRAQSLTYDAMSRLKTANGLYGNQAYDYDDTGNRTATTINSELVNYVYPDPPSSHRLSSLSSGTSFGYTPNGNVSSKGSMTIVYNAANRAAEIAGPGGTVGNLYGASGQRAVKIVNDNWTVFHYDRSGNLIAETSNTAALKQEYVWLDGELLYTSALTPRPEVVVDNTDTGFSKGASWTPDLTGTGYVGVDYVTHASTSVPGSVGVDEGNLILSNAVSTTGVWYPYPCNNVQLNYPCIGGYVHMSPSTVNLDRTFTWRANLPWAGKYQVLTVWWGNTADRASAATYSINHVNGTSNVQVNQRTSCCIWRPLGVYDFAAGTNTVTLSAPAGQGNLLADAMYYIPLEKADGSPAREEAHWAAPDAATYDVYVRWPSSAGDVSSTAVYRIQSADGDGYAVRDQRVNGNAWNLLGTFTFGSSGQQGVFIATDTSRKVVADAVRFVPSGDNVYQRSGAFYHLDHLGTPLKLTDEESGQVVWDASYRPFGEVTLLTNQFRQPLRFPGQYFDAETGLLQNWFRDYDPGMGRYLQPDPIGIEDGPSVFGYSLQNPLRYTDFFGLHHDGTPCRTPGECRCVTAECAAGIAPLPPSDPCVDSCVAKVGSGKLAGKMLCKRIPHPVGRLICRAAVRFDAERYCRQDCADKQRRAGELGECTVDNPTGAPR